MLTESKQTEAALGPFYSGLVQEMTLPHIEVTLRSVCLPWSCSVGGGQVKEELCLRSDVGGCTYHEPGTWGSRDHGQAEDWPGEVWPVVTLYSNNRGGLKPVSIHPDLVLVLTWTRGQNAGWASVSPLCDSAPARMKAGDGREDVR